MIVLVLLNFVMKESQIVMIIILLERLLITLRILKYYQKIAEEANISPASVSRFINKAGFESFQAFKYEFELFTRDVKMRRIISHTQRFMRTTIENMSESLYVDGLANLRQTKLNLDIDKLKEIVKLLKTSKSVTFIGDSHELADFYTL